MMPDALKRRLQAATQKLDALGADVEKLLAYGPVPYKRIPLFASVVAKFAWGEFQYREVTWVNGGEDFHVCGLSYDVGISAFYGNFAPDPYVPGVVTGLVQDNGQTVNAGGTSNFDFMWNYRVMSAATNFGSAANSTTFLPRQLLGNRERGAPLEFDSPLRLRGGDAITFIIKPIFYNEFFIPDPNGPERFFVEMIPYGYRTGVMAASAFDREVEG